MIRMHLLANQAERRSETNLKLVILTVGGAESERPLKTHGWEKESLNNLLPCKEDKPLLALMI